ncbi:MAG TPA: hypothetical protein EYH46_07400 [Sulfurivirga caldicuralii]|nr:hypothetical protein [Sulfurivirga caldicuralii]
MNKLLITFGIVIIWGLIALFFNMPILANLEFIFGLTGFLLLYFKDFDPETASAREKTLRKRWLTVFAIAMLFGLLFGSLWNSEIIQPAKHPDAPPVPAQGPFPGT